MREAAAARPFPALAVAGAALQHLRAHAGTALRLGWPWYAAAALAAALLPADGPGGLAARLLALLAAAVLGAAWARHVLLDERRRGPAPLDAAAAKVLAWQLALGLLLAGPVLGASALRPVSGALAPLASAAAVLLGLWLAARLALVLPLAACGEGTGAAVRAWSIGARAGWRLVLGWIALLFCLLAIAFLVVAVIGSIEAVFRGPGSMPDARLGRVAGVLVQLLAVPALIGYAALAVRELGAGPAPAAAGTRLS